VRKVRGESYSHVTGPVSCVRSKNNSVERFEKGRTDWVTRGKIGTDNQMVT